MTTVSIVNQHTNNYGDDAAGTALVNGLIGEVEANRIDIFYIWHRTQSKLPVDADRCKHHYLETLSGHSDRRVRLALLTLVAFVTRRILTRDMRELVATCRASDLTVVSPAGSNIGIYKDWMYLLTLTLLVIGGIRPIFCQNTIGPSNSALFNRISLYVLRRSDVFVREQASYEWLSSKGIASELGVDTALMEPASPQAHRAGTLAVVPTSLSNWHRDFRDFDDDALLYSALPAAAAAVARERGLTVRVVPHLYGSESEMPMIRRIVDEINALGSSASIADVSSLGEYRAALHEADVAISMRYHGLILAAQGGTPCVAISYENKMIEAASYLGLDGLTIEPKSATADQIRSTTIAALNERPQLTQSMRTRTAALQKVASRPLLSMKRTVGLPS